MNNINFGARYNLSDKANLFSLTERVKLSSAVKKLNKDDLFSIGTRKYNKVDIYSGKSYEKKDVRIDFMVGDEVSSINLSKDFLESEAASSSGKTVTKKAEHKIFKNQILDCVIQLVNDLAENSDIAKTDQTVSQRLAGSQKQDKIVADVKRWSRFQEYCRKTSFFDFLNEEMDNIINIFK